MSRSCDRLSFSSSVSITSIHPHLIDLSLHTTEAEAKGKDSGNVQLLLIGICAELSTYQRRMI